MTKFTREQIKQEIISLNEGKLSYTDSPVYNEWCDMAAEWLTNDPSEYLKYGFARFTDRSVDDILLDFHYNDRLEVPLSDEEVEQLTKL